MFEIIKMGLVRQLFLYESRYIHVDIIIYKEYTLLHVVGFLKQVLSIKSQIWMNFKNTSVVDGYTITLKRY